MIAGHRVQRDGILPRATEISGAVCLRAPKVTTPIKKMKAAKVIMTQSVLVVLKDELQQKASA
jgi:hypothetical protein